MRKKDIAIVAACLLLWMPVSGPIALEQPMVTLEFKDADIKDVLHMLSKQSGVSIVLGGSLEGNITANLEDVPFERALRIILSPTGYVYYWEEGAVVIGSKRMVSRVMRVHFMDAKRIAKALSDFVSEGGAIQAIDEYPTEGVSQREFSNKLVIIDREGRIDQLISMVRELDKPPRQVSIEAKIVETSLSDDEKLGIKWNISGSLTGATAPTTFPFPKSSSDETDFSATPDPGDPRYYEKREFPDGEFFPYAQREDFLFGTVSASEFLVLLQAISTRRNTNLISSPTITTLDNAPAEILVGNQIPIALYERHRETGVMEIIGYDQQNVGVSLWVTPHVGENDTILLEIAPETSSIIEFVGQFNERPITATRTARTQVLVRNGETVVIAGLIREISREIDSRVPFLGHIPLLGRLFSHRDIEKEKVDLLIFITPRITRG